MKKNKENKHIRFNGFALKDMYGNYLFNKHGYGIWVKTGVASKGHLLINERSTVIEFSDEELNLLFPKATPK